MSFHNSIRRIVLIATGFSLSIGAAAWLVAQEDTEKYRQDYEKVQKIVAITDPVRRSDQLFEFIKGKPDPKIEEYAQGVYYQAMDGLLKAENYQVLLSATERYVKIRPRVPETYYFYGAALRHVDRIPESYAALAKCSVVRNPASAKARSFLEFIYKQKNGGGLSGLDKIIKQAQEDMK